MYSVYMYMNILQSDSITVPPDLFKKYIIATLNNYSDAQKINSQFSHLTSNENPLVFCTKWIAGSVYYHSCETYLACIATDNTYSVSHH